MNDRYELLPLIAIHKATGQTCRVFKVLTGNRWCVEGDLVLEIVGCGEMRYRLLSSDRFPVYDEELWDVNKAEDKEHASKS